MQTICIENIYLLTAIPPAVAVDVVGSAEGDDITELSSTGRDLSEEIYPSYDCTGP